MDASNTIGLYSDDFGYGKCVDEALRIRCTSSSVLFLFVTVLQHGADVRRTFEKHERYMSSIIHEHSSTAKRKELIRRLLYISNTHGSSFLRENSFFRRHLKALRRFPTDTELNCMSAYLRPCKLKITDSASKEITTH